MKTEENIDDNLPTKSIATSQQNFDISDVIGRDGPWQRRICIIGVFFYILASSHTFSMSFLAPNLDHWCARSPDARNLSIEQWRNIAMPSSDKHCSRYKHVNITHLLESRLNISEEPIIPCEKWEYDTTSYHNTVLSQFDLVCDRKWLVSLSKSVYTVGMSFSLILFGHLPDRVGRKPIIVISGLIAFIAQVISAFSSTFFTFLIARFCIAFGVTGSRNTLFTLLMEVVAPTYRNIYGIGVQFGWTLGLLTLLLIAYLVRDSFWFQMALTSPCLILLAFWWLPESPRWLLQHGKTEEAKKILLEAAKINGVKQSEEDKEMLNTLLSKGTESYISGGNKTNIFYLMKTSGLWQITLIVFFCWFVIAFVYYGLSINTNELAGDPFVNFAFSGVAEIPADLLVIFLAGPVGKKKLLTATMMISGAACFTSYFVPSDLWWVIVILYSIGKLAITSAFCIIYIFTSEVFPTVVRNTGLGSASLCGRFGSLIAPFMREMGYATHPIFPQIIFGVLALASGLLVTLLPETKNRSVPDTMEEAAQLSKRKVCQVQNGVKENCITVKLTEVETTNEQEAQTLLINKAASSA